MENPVITFNDQQGRQISIGEDCGAIVAENNDQEIGRFDFDILESDFSCINLLTNCNIKSEYQRCGIGTEMIKLAEDWYDSFSIVNHLSIEGAGFLNHCLKNVCKLEHPLVDDDRF